MSSNLEYGKQDYWDSRFSTEDEYEWLLSFDVIKSKVTELISTHDKILIIGCGNSPFSGQLYDQGFVNITNIDYSPVVIEKMAYRNSSLRPLMKWLVMDMTELGMENEAFDVVIDKAAMDALMVDEGDVWYPNDSVVNLADKMCKQIGRVMKRKGGRFLQISFAQPHFRTKYLMGLHATKLTENLSPYIKHEGYSSIYDWELTSSIIDTEDGCFNYFLYIMNRGKSES